MTRNNRPIALTIREPWIWAIVYAGKRVENRSWITRYRGPIYLHAAAGLARVSSRVECCEKIVRRGLTAPTLSELARGALVATADLVDCTRDVPRGQALWADKGAVYFVLNNVRVLPRPIAVRGRLGLWRVPKSIQTRYELTHVPRDIAM